MRINPSGHKSFLFFVFNPPFIYLNDNNTESIYLNFFIFFFIKMMENVKSVAPFILSWAVGTKPFLIKAGLCLLTR